MEKQWIKTSEQMPLLQHLQRVKCNVGSGIKFQSKSDRLEFISQGKVLTGHYHKDIIDGVAGVNMYFKAAEMEFDFRDVSHWMSLPELPQEKQYLSDITILG